MKTLSKIILIVLFLLIPIVARGLWYYRGTYTPPTQTDIESLQITLPEVSYAPVADTPPQGDGRVVLDLTHENNLEIDDLTPLRDRLAARGVEVVTLTDYFFFTEELRGATALVVIAPIFPFDSTERDAVQAFIEDGGKLLIAADPTRPVPAFDEFDLFSIFFPTSAVPTINGLANLFGVTYNDDYLYNLSSNEGNYRNVSFTDLSGPLMEGVNEIVLFAAHSLQGGEPVLTGDKNTLSNKRSGETGLTPAVLAADGNVLALGDMTLFTAPYHTVAGNDQFLSNLADWLAQDGRDWDLVDFPYLFDDEVAYAQLKRGNIAPRLFVFGSTLQSSLNTAGIELVPTDTLTPTQDALLAGTYLEHEAVASILQTAGVTVTLTFTNTLEDETPTLEDLEEGTLTIAGLGTLDINGTTFYLEFPAGEDETAILVLAYDETDLVFALENLIYGFPSGCLEYQKVKICSTGDAIDGSSGAGGGEDDSSTPPPSENGDGIPPIDASSVFILAMDNGTDGVYTSAYDLQFYLGEFYNVTLWSVAFDGIPTADNLTGYDVMIIDSGDYSFDFETFDALSALEILSTIPTWFLGAQPLFAFETEPLVDIEVAETTHPILFGLENASFELSDSISGIPEQLFLPEDFEGSDGTTSIIWVRGPGNGTPGGPVLFTIDDGSTSRWVVSALPLYRLSFDVQETLSLNVVNWLLGGG